MDNEEQRSGYEGGGYQENRSGYGNQNNSGGYRGGNNRGNYPSSQGSGGQHGGGNNFRRFARRDANQEPRDFSVDPPVLYRPYVGTCNTGAPEMIVKQMEEVCDVLDGLGYTTRTSAFDGDKPFLRAKRKEVILPWRDFAGHTSKLTFSSEEAKWFAKKFFPAYDQMKNTVQGFLAKNVRLMCGQNLKSPAQFLITWTEDGCEDNTKRSPQTGNMGHVITIANELRAPVFNFQRSDAKDRLFKYLKIETSTP